MYKRGYLQISFAWLFAIIVGVFILFLAILGVSKVIKFGEFEQSAKTSQEIGILLNPLETGFESARVTSLRFPTETRIYNKCSNTGTFGKQGIQVSQKSLKKWTETDYAEFSNKYIFSETYAEGKTFYFFSKPFKFPFKVADLIYLISASEEYCFLDAPEEIQEEISDLKQETLKTEDCSEKAIKVCFGNENCEINVDYNSRVVEKDGEEMYFEEDALMYAAVFSDKATYECQLRRLMQRAEQLSLLYRDKAVFISDKCDTNLNPDLLFFSSSAGNFQSSDELYLMKITAEDLEEKNNANWGCELW